MTEVLEQSWLDALSNTNVKGIKTQELVDKNPNANQPLGMTDPNYVNLRYWYFHTFSVGECK